MTEGESRSDLFLVGFRWLEGSATLSGTEGERMSEYEFFRIKFGDLAESCYICSKEVWNRFQKFTFSFIFEVGF